MQILSINKKLSILERYNIDVLFSFEEIDNSKQYTKIIFSIFDHWLTEKEAEEKIFLYDDIVFATDQNKKDIYSVYENKFLEFYNMLYYEYNVYLMLKDIEGALIFCNFDSNDEYIEIIKTGIREQFSFSMFVPEFESIFSNGFDFTHYINIRNTKNLNSNKLAMKEMIKKNKLFVLNDSVEIK